MICAFRDVIDLWPTSEAFATDVGCKLSTAYSWVARDTIPGDWFAAVVKSAADRGFDGVTAQKLCDLAEQRRLRKSEKRPHAAGPAERAGTQALTTRRCKPVHPGV